jgi:hypothetical protein
MALHECRWAPPILRQNKSSGDLPELILAYFNAIPLQTTLEMTESASADFRYQPRSDLLGSLLAGFPA